MAFGSGKRRRFEAESAVAARSDDEDIDIGDDINADDEVRVIDVDYDNEVQTAGKINPLLAEITMIGGERGKNDSGSKQWRCNHCKKTFKSSLTRVRVHLLGALPGKKPQIQRCPVLLNDATKTRELQAMVDRIFSLPFAHNRYVVQIQSLKFQRCILLLFR
jgi:hypothetical protein